MGELKVEILNTMPENHTQKKVHQFQIDLCFYIQLLKFPGKALHL